MRDNKETIKRACSSLLYGLLNGMGCLIGGMAGPGALFLGVSILERMHVDQEVGILAVLIFVLVLVLSIPVGAAIGIAISIKFYEAIIKK